MFISAGVVEDSGRVQFAEHKLRVFVRARYGRGLRSSWAMAAGIEFAP
jgi:hypothetical protein